MNNKRIQFTVESRSSRGAARAGVLTTPHSTIQTPVFMPVGTHAVVRNHDINTLSSIGFQIMLSNTFHLLLRPGPEVLRQFGGVHRFMNWPRSVLTDSGGFQLFSMPDFMKISDEGAEFRSYVDGRYILLTPELSIATQGAINSDIMMVLDQCVNSTSEKPVIKEAMDRTYAWAKRSLAARGDSHQALFAIVQGGCFPDLRRESAAQLTDLPFDGFALGGLAVGEDLDRRNEVISYSANLLPADMPRYLMGVGTPLDLLESVARGMDMFDCILPTALAQQGVCFTSTGKLDLKRGVYKFADEPLDRNCPCSTCRSYSRAYLHHLLKVGEHQGGTLIGTHNLRFYYTLMNEMRSAIIADSFEDYYRAQKPILSSGDAANPPVPPYRKPPSTKEELGDYVVHRRGDVISIRQKSSGEVMHSVSEPTQEAVELYLNQSRLVARVTQHPELPLVLWDVGLGAATNAMAVVSAYEKVAKDSSAPIAPLHIVSFENDLDSLRLVLKHPNLFTHIRHSAPAAISQTHSWRSKQCQLSWTLISGDFLKTKEDAPPPDIIFYDPFSFKTDSPLWSLECFQGVFRKTKESGTELFTYSASTSVRAALLAAGFSVARGVPVGPKAETTIGIAGAVIAEHTHHLLRAEWLARWERSDSKHPVGMRPEDKDSVESTIRGHVQFRSNQLTHA